MNEAEIIEKLTETAKRISGGHFTICRFGSNWRVGFLTPNDRCDVCAMHVGKTLGEAAQSAIDSDRRSLLDGFGPCACHAEAQKDDEQLVKLWLAQPEGSA